MAHTIVAGYHDLDAAKQVMARLAEIGYSNKEVGFATQQLNNEFTALIEERAEETSSEIGKGTIIGAIAGLVAGLAVLPIVGLGTLAVAGPIGGILGLGAVSGASIGGLAGALRDSGVDEHEVDKYVDFLKGEGVLVAVQPIDELMPETRELFRQSNAELLSVPKA